MVWCSGQEMYLADAGYPFSLKDKGTLEKS
jgi:hypothetical protein